MPLVCFCPFFRRPLCVRPSVVSCPGPPGPWGFVFAPAPPPSQFFVPPWFLLFRCFRPWVPWIAALCGCPPPAFLSFFFFLRPRSSRVPAPGARGLSTAWLGFFFLPRVEPCMWGVRCALLLCPPPPAASLGVLLCLAVFCVVGSVLRYFSVPCCAGLQVSCCVVCCCVVLLILLLVVSLGAGGAVSVGVVRCLAVPCCCVRCFVVFCAVACFLPCCELLWCPVFSGLLVCWIVLCYVGCVRLCCSVPPPLLLPLSSGPLLLPGPLSWPVVVLCSWVPCCVVLF